MNSDVLAGHGTLVMGNSIGFGCSVAQAVAKQGSDELMRIK